MENLKKTVARLYSVFKKDKYFIFLSLSFFIFLALYWGKFGDPVIDCGREAYIPFAMADLGKVLFKDIICIYGPVPYYLNAFIVKLFGANFNTCYLIGVMLSYLFLFGIYNLAKRFLNANLACLYGFIILFVCVLNPSISNFIFPYSYAIVYSLVFAVFHLIFLFKFIDSVSFRAPDYKKLCVSALFLALCLLSKLDFIPCILPFLIILAVYRKVLSPRVFAKICLSFLIPFFAVILILIFQHVTFQNLIFNFKMISNMAHSPSLQYFYTVCTGYFFDFKKTFMFIPKFLLLSLIFIITGILGYFTFKIKNTFLKISTVFIISIFFAAVLFVLNLVRYIFLYLPLLILTFFIIKIFIFGFKKFKTPETRFSCSDVEIYSFILFSILFSLKTLFGLFHELYGTFYLPFVLLSFLIIILIIIKNHKPLAIEAIKTISIVIIAVFALQNFLIFFTVKNTPLKTPSGVIYMEKPLAASMDNAIKYLKADLKENDTVLVLPEGLIINFILKKESPFYNTSFTPLDFDAYGEEYLIENLSNSVPKYLLIFKRNYNDYGKNFICEDFGQKFCEKIDEIYDKNDILNDKSVETPSDSYLIRIFERKDND